MLGSHKGVLGKVRKTFWERFETDPEVGILLRVLEVSSDFDKELYLLELILNACDALDKVDFQTTTDNVKPFIGIVPDKAKKRISIIDTGVGMTREDLVNKLIPVWRSGESGRNIFVEAGQAGENESMLWQSGVGFLSAFLVAEQVIVATKHNDDERYIWFSEGGCSFALNKDLAKDRLHRGTKITLYLKENLLEYLEEKRIRDLVQKHSDFIWYPVYIWTEKWIGDDKDGEAKKDAEGEIVKIDEGKKETNGWQLIDVKPIWFRNPDEITKKDFVSLYKCLTGDSEDHLAVKYFSVDVQQKVKAILFVPKRALFDHFDAQMKNPGIQLCVKRAFYRFEKLPEFLGFVKGIVVTDDVPDGKIVDVVRLELVRKSIEMFNELAKSKADYHCFYEAFSKDLKLGFKDRQNVAKLADLLRYYSTKSGVEMTSLKDYITRMEEGQKCIYYIAGKSKEAVEKSPLLESLTKKGCEVLFMVDAGDEVVLEMLREYDGKKLVSAASEGSKLEEKTEVSKKREEETRSYEKLCKTFELFLGDKVEKVVVSDRIVGYPCCVVNGNEDSYANEKGWNKQAAGMPSNVTFVINPDNVLMEEIRMKTEELIDLMELFFKGAMLGSKARMEDVTPHWDGLYDVANRARNVGRKMKMMS